MAVEIGDLKSASRGFATSVERTAFGFPVIPGDKARAVAYHVVVAPEKTALKVMFTEDYYFIRTA